MLFQLPNGMEFMRQLRSSKMKVKHQDDINALALCDQADRNVYPILHRVYKRKISAPPAPPANEVGLDSALAPVRVGPGFVEY